MNDRSHQILSIKTLFLIPKVNIPDSPRDFKDCDRKCGRFLNYQSMVLSIENRVIFLEVFFWNSTSLSFTRLTALYGGILAFRILT